MSSPHHLYACLLLTLYLAPCAWQDWRTRKVSNWLTVPAFVAAWPLAIWFGNLEWTVAVFVGCYVAWQFKGMGAADGKLAILVTAINPTVLLYSTSLLCVGFLYQWRRKSQNRTLPAVVYLFIGLFLSLCLSYTKL